MRKAVDASLNLNQREPGSTKIYSDWDKLVSARTLASPLSEKSAMTLLNRGTTNVEGGVAVNADPRLKHPSAMYMTEEVVLEFISHIACPSLLILAEEGVVGKRSTTSSRIEKFQDLEVARLPGQHHLHMDTPEPVGDAINAFLRERKA